MRHNLSKAYLPTMAAAVLLGAAPLLDAADAGADPGKRIAELEQQVKELKGQVRDLKRKLGEPEAPAAAPPAAVPAAPALPPCVLKEADLPGGMRKRSFKGRTVFYNKAKSAGGQELGNFFQVCFNGNQTVSFQGLVYDIRDAADGNLVVETVEPDSFVAPAAAGDWRLEKGKIVARSGASFGATARRIYDIPQASLSAANLAKEGPSGSVAAEKLAWVRVDGDPRDPAVAASLVVFLRGGQTPAQAQDSVTKALGAFAEKTPYYSDLKFRDKFIDFVVKQVSKSGVASDFRLTVNLLTSAELAATDKDLYKELAVFDASDSDKLIYCPRLSGPETLQEHIAHLPK